MAWVSCRGLFKRKSKKIDTIINFGTYFLQMASQQIWLSNEYTWSGFSEYVTAMQCLCKLTYLSMPFLHISFPQLLSLGTTVARNVTLTLLPCQPPRKVKVLGSRHATSSMDGFYWSSTTGRIHIQAVRDFIHFLNAQWLKWNVVHEIHEIHCINMSVNEKSEKVEYWTKVHNWVWLLSTVTKMNLSVSTSMEENTQNHASRESK